MNIILKTNCADVGLPNQVQCIVEIINCAWLERMLLDTQTAVMQYRRLRMLIEAYTAFLLSVKMLCMLKDAHTTVIFILSSVIKLRMLKDAYTAFLSSVMKLCMLNEFYRSICFNLIFKK